jgi:hypothetical protein
MKLKNSTIMELLNAHRSLGDVKLPGDEGSKCRYGIVRNIRKLTAASEDVMAAQNAIVSELGNGSASLKPNSAEMFEFNKRFEAVLKLEVDVPLWALSYRTLTGSSEISPNVLAALEPVLTDEPKDDEQPL